MKKKFKLLKGKKDTKIGRIYVGGVDPVTSDPPILIASGYTSMPYMMLPTRPISERYRISNEED